VTPGRDNCLRGYVLTIFSDQVSQMSADVSLPNVVRTCNKLRAAVAQARSSGMRIGLVPTMGALHEGHLSLVDASNRACDFTIVTIFVNPTQFGEGEDLDAYPRQLEADLESLSEFDVDVVFAPPKEEIYPDGFSTFVEVGGVTQVLEGAERPIHFRGVATVCAKLFNLAQADIAFFGQKDYQQTLVVKRVAKDLDIPTEIRVCPTVRESDGLAMSSRNVYLSADERQQARVLSKCLRRAVELKAAGETDAAKILAEMQVVLDTATGIVVDYLVLVDPETLKPVESANQPTLAAVAARIGQTRLIDNELL
jgi:pantoate--beta-alanine ligase